MDELKNQSLPGVYVYIEEISWVEYDWPHDNDR
jgi:hypothetical protein